MCVCLSLDETTRRPCADLLEMFGNVWNERCSEVRISVDDAVAGRKRGFVYLARSGIKFSTRKAQEEDTICTIARLP